MVQANINASPTERMVANKVAEIEFPSMGKNCAELNTDLISSKEMVNIKAPNGKTTVIPKKRKTNSLEIFIDLFFMISATCAFQ